MADGVTTETGSARIEAAFEGARRDGRAALMPYLMGGFPDQGTATAVAGAYADAGADLIELGVPFSDPLADGPTIHAADTAALAAGATLESVLETCAEVGGRIPVALMVYANMVLAAGPVEFAERAAAAKASGVIVPDLPLEEQGPIREALAAHGLALIPLVAPDDSAGAPRADLRERRGLRLPRLNRRRDGRTRRASGRAHRADRGRRRRRRACRSRSGSGSRLRSRRPPSGGSPTASSSAPGWCVLWRTPLMEMPPHPL